MPLSAHLNTYLIKLIIPLNKTGLLPGSANFPTSYESRNFKAWECHCSEISSNKPVFWEFWFAAQVWDKCMGTFWKLICVSKQKSSPEHFSQKIRHTTASIIMHHDERRVSKVHGIPSSLNHNHLYTHATCRYTGQRMYNSYRLCWAYEKGIGFTSIPQPSLFTQGYLHDKSNISIFHDLYHIARYNPLDFEDRLWSEIRNTLCIHKKMYSTCLKPLCYY